MSRIDEIMELTYGPRYTKDREDGGYLVLKFNPNINVPADQDGVHFNISQDGYYATVHSAERVALMWYHDRKPGEQVAIVQVVVSNEELGAVEIIDDASE